MPIVERRKSEDVADFLFEKFSILPVTGGAYGYYTSTKWTVISYLSYIVIYSSMILLTLDLLFTSWLLFDNMSLFSFAFHVFLVGCTVLTASVSITLQRRYVTEWIEVVCLNENLAEYQKGKYYEDLKQLSDQRIARIMIMFLIGYGNCGLVAVSAPFVDWYLGYDEDVTNVSGIYWKQLPVAMWFPFDAHSSAAAWLSFLLLQGASAFAAPNMVTAAIILCFFTSECLLNHMKLLTHAVKHLDQRANAMFTERYHIKPSLRFEQEYDHCYYECIKQNVKHHCKIKKQLAALLILANYAIAVPFFAGALLLGLAGFNLMSQEDPRIGPKCVVFCLAMTEAANIFLLCLYGERFKTESEKLFNAVINTKWYRRSKKCKRALLILQSCTFEPMKFSAAKLIELNMETFANIVNSAYSIFNLSAASSGGH